MWLAGAIGSVDDFVKYLVKQKNNGLSGTSLNKCIQAVKHYSDFYKLDWTLPKYQKEVSRVRQTYSDGEIRDIIDLEKNQYSDYFKLLAHTGCRPQECLAISYKDYDALRNCVILRGFKTNTDRLVPLPKLSIDWSALPFAFTSESANNELKRRCEKLNIPYRSQYSFRHSFATRLIDNDADLFSVKTLMGHKKLDTTAIYYHTSLTHLQKAIDRDTLNIDNMTPDQKLDLLKKHLEETVNKLRLNKDKSLQVELIIKDDAVELRVKKDLTKT